LELLDKYIVFGIFAGPRHDYFTTQFRVTALSVKYYLQLRVGLLINVAKSGGVPRAWQNNGRTLQIIFVR
jgi:hypothetical protein